MRAKDHQPLPHPSMVKTRDHKKMVYKNALEEIAELHENYESSPAFERSALLQDARDIARAALKE